MPVYRLDIAYDGSSFRGYARQQGLHTIQGELERALEVLIGEEVGTTVAGRTDAGVHALGQVVSFSYAGDVDDTRLLKGLNGLVGPEISVRGVARESDEFSARFSAKWRRYRYLIDQAPAADPLTRGHVWTVGRALDVEAMSAAAVSFVGEHDFSSFCRSIDGKSNVRRVTELDLSVTGSTIEIAIEANAFCHQMVRSIVGFLFDVGRGFTDPKTADEVIGARDRAGVATVAPPHGLTLMEVGYDG